jgi:hypothetical protein
VGTLRSHVTAAAAEVIGEPAYWCATDSCPVAYYDLLERTLATAEAHAPGVQHVAHPTGHVDLVVLH